MRSFLIFFLDNESCPGEILSDIVAFDAASAGCSVEPDRSNDFYVYNATIMSGPAQTSSIISRTAGMELKFSCVLERRQTVSLESGVNVNVNYIFVDFGFELGAFEIEMTVYNSSDFIIPARSAAIFYQENIVF